MAWKRITINVEPELAQLAKTRAKQRRQSVASYFASLLEQDIEASGVVREDPASYGISPKPPPRNDAIRDKAQATEKEVRASAVSTQQPKRKAANE